MLTQPAQLKTKFLSEQEHKILDMLAQRFAPEPALAFKIILSIIKEIPLGGHHFVYS